MYSRTLLLLAALAAAVPSSAGFRDRMRRGEARQGACQKGCIAPHDSSVIGCKLFKTPDESQECVASAQEKRARCESGCRERAQERERVKSERERSPKEDRRPAATPARAD